MTPEQRECARLRANAMAGVTGSCRDGPRNGRGSRKGSAGRFCRGDARRRESGRNGGNILPPRRLRPRVASLSGRGGAAQCDHGGDYCGDSRLALLSSSPMQLGDARIGRKAAAIERDTVSRCLVPAFDGLVSLKMARPFETDGTTVRRETALEPARS
jgi:hypothetical protein